MIEAGIFDGDTVIIRRGDTANNGEIVVALVLGLGDTWGDDRMIDDIEFVRTVAVARITMPRSMVRLSAGRESMSDELQALCFAAGANSIFHGEKLLTTGNPDTERDRVLFARLGLRPMPISVDAADHDHPATRHATITLAPAHVA